MSEKRWVGADMLQENLLLSLTLENADVGPFVCEDDENTQNGRPTRIIVPRDYHVSSR